jgi:uncharacterized protein (DUF697 family)
VPGPLKLANVWRVVRDVDLTAVRDAARGRFTMVVTAEDVEDAARLRGLMAGDAGASHPWVEVSPALPDALGATSSDPIVGLVIARNADLTEGLRLAIDRFRTAGTPVLTVVVGDAVRHAGAPRRGETRRVVVSALDTDGVEAVAAALFEIVDDDRQLALAAQLPGLRTMLFGRIIEQTARANASFAFTTGVAETVPVLTAPLNLGDIVILTKNQLMMCYRLALAAGRDGDPRELMGEVAGVLGGGLLFRQAARELVGLIPVIGLLPKVAIAYAGTVAIGRAMVAWITEGRRVTSEAVTRYSKDGLDRGRALAERWSKERRPPAAGSRMARLRQYLPGLGRR